MFSIVPPYILKALSGHEDRGIADAAKVTLAHDQHFRGELSQTLIATTQASRPSANLPEAAGVIQERPPKQRYIYDNEGRNYDNLPGKLARQEGQPATGDPGVDEVYDGLGVCLDFFYTVFGRNSLDNNGKRLSASVHYEKQYKNAHWDGTRFIFGDGDNVLLLRPSRSLEVIGHEFGHAIVQYTAGLHYANQSGALNESFADIFGSLIKQWQLGQDVHQADWLIGAEMVVKSEAVRALRSMREPGTAYNDDNWGGKDPQPAHMTSYVRTRKDFGGVHWNSGIPNRAFYLVAAALGGNAWTHAGRIWYDTLRDTRLNQDTTFSAFAGLTVKNAGRIYGDKSSEAKAVKAAWEAVGVPKVTSRK